MQGKLMFALGAAAGYVFGTRSGRKGYERLKSQASNLWLNPRVQETVSTVGEFAKDKIPVVGGTIADASQKLTDRVRSDSGAHSASSGGTADGPPTAPSTNSPGTNSGMAGATSGSPSFSNPLLPPSAER
ncbi:MAG: hypothetical protein JWM49_2802 [Microbacteriaceae bacterium]|nr:hypothetical protein [Microbacteriaceae bacterium]